MQAEAPPHSNLYVKGLPPSLDQGTLQQLFQAYGAIESCRIVRDVTTGVSKGYGFVKFSSVQNAEDAIREVNGSSIGDFTLEVKFADVDAGPAPLGARTPSDNLYCKNLPQEWTEQDLRNLFQPYGSIKECRLLPALPDSPQGAGALVRMGSIEEATRAIEGVNSWAASTGTGTGSFPILVRFADTPEEKARKQAKRNKARPFNPYEPQLPAGFTAFPSGGDHSGQAAMAAGPSAGGSAYYAPASVQQGGMGQQVVQGMQAQYSGYEAGPSYSSQPYQQQQAQASYIGPMNGASGPYQQAAPMRQQSQQQQAFMAPQQPTSLYIKNLPPDADKLFLYERFAPHGSITSVKVMLDESTGKCRGVGFVNYTSFEGARAAIAAMHGSIVGEKVLHVSLQQQRESSRGRSH